MTQGGFESDDPFCDVRIYTEHAALYAVHVLTDRVEGDVPPVDLDAPPEVVIEQVFAQRDFIRRAKRVPLPPECAGEVLWAHSLDALNVTLTLLQNLGYRVPATVFAAIDAAIAARATAANTQREQAHG